MKTDAIKEKNIIEYMKRNINNVLGERILISKYFYYYRTNYENATRILNYGISPSSDNLKTSLYTDHFSSNFSDDYFDVFDDEYVDFLVAGEVTAEKSKAGYKNEYETKKEILQTELLAIDIRLINYLNDIKRTGIEYLEREDILSIIDKYNNIREIATTIKDNNLDIPFREMSGLNNTSIDISKASEMNILKLRK